MIALGKTPNRKELIMKALKILDEKFEEYFLAVTLSISVILIFLQVVMRYVFSNSLSWTEEMARYLFLWQIWVGAAYAVKKNKHLNADILRSLLPVDKQKYLDLISTVIWLLFSIFLVYKSSTLVSTIARMGQLSPAMRMPMEYAYASVPVGCSLMAIRLVQKIYLDNKKMKMEGVK